MFMSIDKVNKGEVMKKVFLVSMVSLGIWSCGGGNSDGWSSAEQQAYLNGCMSSGVQTAEKEEICKCTLDPIMKKYSFSEYGELEGALMSGNGSLEFSEFILEVSFGCVGLEVPKED